MHHSARGFFFQWQLVNQFKLVKGSPKPQVPQEHWLVWVIETTSLQFWPMYTDSQFVSGYNLRCWCCSLKPRKALGTARFPVVTTATLALNGNGWGTYFPLRTLGGCLREGKWNMGLIYVQQGEAVTAKNYGWVQIEWVIKGCCHISALSCHMSQPLNVWSPGSYYSGGYILVFTCWRR